MMEFPISSHQFFQPFGQVRALLVFDSGGPVIVTGVDDNMLGVWWRGVRKRFVSVDAKSTGKNR